MTLDDIHVRPATATDLRTVAAILAANDEPIEWPGVPGWPYLEHLLSRARMPVAEVGGRVAGFGASINGPWQDVRFLTDLFVDPHRQERGIGRAVLDAALEGATERMTFSSADDRALGLYIRAGMRPWWPLLYIEGGPVAPDAPSSELADVETIARWAESWTGMDRTVDFAHYASLPDARGFLVRDAGAVVAVGWARRPRRVPGRWLDHASIAPDADPLRAALGVWRAAIGGADRLAAAIPGPHPVVATLIERGARIYDRDTFCATDPDLIDPERMFPNPGFV